MKQHLMALAVAGALAAPGLSHAQTTTSPTNVQIYGVFDVRGDYMKLSNSAAGIGQVSKTHLSTGAPNRIGFRGIESLGGGLSAFFQVETQIFTDARQDTANAAHTNATLGGRPTFLGVRGGWGEVSLGYQDSVYKTVYQTTWSVNPDNAMFGAIMGNGNSSGAVPSPNCNGLTASGTGALLATPAPAASSNCAEAESSTTAFNRIVSDSIIYRSPVIAGFRFGAQMTANEFKAPTSSTVAGTNQVDPRFGAYSLNWAAGPFSVAGALEQHTGFRATNAVGTNNQAKDTGITLGARWNYGAGLIGAGWERLKYGNTTTGNDFERKNWIVQGTFNLSAQDVIFAGYSKTPGASACGAALAAAACGSATGAKFITFGIDHSFSKRTAVYAYWSKIDNNSAANYNYLSDSRPTSNASGSGSGLLVGQDSTLYALGVKHSF